MREGQNPALMAAAREARDSLAEVGSFTRPVDVSAIGKTTHAPSEGWGPIIAGKQGKERP